MSRDDWWDRPSAQQRRRITDAARNRLRRKRTDLAPVHVQGRAIAKTFWGKAWCTNLEAYSDYGNRLPRGRTYARNGSILDLRIAEGRIDAVVSGTRVYDVAIRIDTLPEQTWKAIRAECAGEIDSVVELLQGRLSQGVMGIVTRPRTGLFPEPCEIHLGCSCPDWAVMCKHVAAVLYGVGNRLDQRPEMLFSLRGVDPADMIAEAVTTPPAATGRVLDVADLSAVFGVDIDFSDDALAAPEDPDLPARARQVLELIREQPGKRSPELAERLGVSRSTIATAVAILKERGLVAFVGAPRTGGYEPTPP